MELLQDSLQLLNDDWNEERPETSGTGWAMRGRQVTVLGKDRFGHFHK